MQEADHRVKDALRLRPHLATTIHSNAGSPTHLTAGHRGPRIASFLRVTPPTKPLSARSAGVLRTIAG
jgi:hypothetical protein